MKNIKILRLITGEEILAEVLQNDETKVIVKNPIRIVVLQNRTKPEEPTIGLAPWTEFSSDDQFTLDKTHIIIIMSPINEFINQYQATFSKIITPQSGLILPNKG